MSSSNELVNKLNPNWYSLSILSLLVLGILMLFFKELPDIIKERMIPALVIYTIGTGLIGYFQGAYFRAKSNKSSFKEPFWIYFILNVIWFGMFIIYLIMRSIL